MKVSPGGGSGMRGTWMRMYRVSLEGGAGGLFLVEGPGDGTCCCAL